MVNPSPAPNRLDVFLVAHGHFETRARAQAAVKAGLVRINGAIAGRPAAAVAPGAAVTVAGDVHPYVSRGGLKLVAGLRSFGVDPAGRVCLDLGASTGGFTDVLLRSGAAKVYAVDVGSGQLHPKIAGDPRVVNLERTHAKDLAPELISERIDIIVCDVSFISLRKVLPYALALAAPGARLVALVKPQFELGRRKIGKGGLVRAEQGEIGEMLRALTAWIGAEGWRIDGVINSPIAGGDGNEEHLLGATASP